MSAVRITASQVVIGDVLCATGGYPRRVVFGFHARDSRTISPKTIDAHETVGVGSPPRMPMPTEQWAPAMLIEVERAELTPAQQHADDLLELVRETVRHGGHAATLDAMRTLLTHIDPPKPPTLGEALAMLRDIREVIDPPGLGVTTGQMLDVLLDRARRSGVLK